MKNRQALLLKAFLCLIILFSNIPAIAAPSRCIDGLGMVDALGIPLYNYWFEVRYLQLEKTGDFLTGEVTPYLELCKDLRGRPVEINLVNPEYGDYWIMDDVQGFGRGVKNFTHRIYVPFSAISCNPSQETDFFDFRLRAIDWDYADEPDDAGSKQYTTIANSGSAQGEVQVNLARSFIERDDNRIVLDATNSPDAPKERVFGNLSYLAYYNDDDLLEEERLTNRVYVVYALFRVRLLTTATTTLTEIKEKDRDIHLAQALTSLRQAVRAGSSFFDATAMLDKIKEAKLGFSDPNTGYTAPGLAAVDTDYKKRWEQYLDALQSSSDE